VDAYGSSVPVKQLASVGAPEPTQIVVRPYDPNVIKDIEKVIGLLRDRGEMAILVYYTIIAQM
jgi:ribosome recycling factor